MSLETLVDHAAELVDAIADQAERDRQSYEAGYRDAAQMARAMFDHGVDVGREQAEREMAEAWRPVARYVQDQAKYVDLERDRWGPGGRQRFGDPRPGDFTGSSADIRRVYESWGLTPPDAGPWATLAGREGR